MYLFFWLEEERIGGIGYSERLIAERGKLSICSSMQSLPHDGRRAQHRSDESRSHLPKPNRAEWE